MASGGGSSSASEHGALRASAQSRSRSYGSTARLPTSPGRRQEHRLRPGDTLAGLALHYGVNTEQIRRENRLHTNDSIFLKDVLWIPAVGKEYVSRMESNTEGARSLAGDTETEPDPELSATEFLRRLDARITQSKAAALQKLREEGDRSDGNCPSSVIRQQSLLGPARLTETARVTRLRDVEDRIFDL
ncbi:lysM and putative peptidoglycan-binding domain-containing protein 1 isoform X4 [Narcine bancroftii]|uniref:lysM and putative peptidoglycan-binding domain-containing protein 1 isoform X4 n=1 Tax=Narcine bancroftii TaxID=1343680 RepID=UPI00383158BB